MYLFQKYNIELTDTAVMSDEFFFIFADGLQSLGYNSPLKLSSISKGILRKGKLIVTYLVFPYFYPSKFQLM